MRQYRVRGVYCHALSEAAEPPGAGGQLTPPLFRVRGPHAAFDPPLFVRYSDFDPHFSLPSAASANCCITVTGWRWLSRVVDSYYCCPAGAWVGPYLHKVEHAYTPCQKSDLIPSCCEHCEPRSDPHASCGCEFRPAIRSHAVHTSNNVEATGNKVAIAVASTLLLAWTGLNTRARASSKHCFKSVNI